MSSIVVFYYTFLLLDAHLQYSWQVDVVSGTSLHPHPPTLCMPLVQGSILHMGGTEIWTCNGRWPQPKLCTRKRFWENGGDQLDIDDITHWVCVLLISENIGVSTIYPIHLNKCFVDKFLCHDKRLPKILSVSSSISLSTNLSSCNIMFQLFSFYNVTNKKKMTTASFWYLL